MQHSAVVPQTHSFILAVKQPSLEGPGRAWTMTSGFSSKSPILNNTNPQYCVFSKPFILLSSIQPISSGKTPTQLTNGSERTSAHREQTHG